MKRKIGLIIILFVELCLGLIYYVKPIWEIVKSNLPFMEDVKTFAAKVVDYFKPYLNFEFFTSLNENIQNIIIVILLNIVFIIVYLIVFGLISAIIRHHKVKKLEQNSKKITLSDEEKAKFEWRLYEKRFPIRRLLSLLIPTLIFLIFIVIRYDHNICVRYDKYHQGVFYFYGEIESNLGMVATYIDSIIGKYITFNNRLVDSIKVIYVEWIEIGVCYVLVLLIWWGFFSIFAKPFRIVHAKALARKAKKKYIIKMENLEYKALKNSIKENLKSKKSKELYQEDKYDLEPESDVKIIAKPFDEKSNEPLENYEALSKNDRDYIDDISTGVTDLGVIEEDTTELQKPLTTRETKFVGEEEVDIVLDEEPIIETIEEEETYYNGEPELEDETFVRYQNDNALNINIEDKIKKYNIDVIDENKSVIHYEEEGPIIKDYEDNEIDNSAHKMETSNEKEKESSSLENVLSETVTFENAPISEINNLDKKEEIVTKKEIKPIAIKKVMNEVENEEKTLAKPLEDNLSSSSTHKPIKPINISKDQDKIVEYILSTNKNNLSQVKEEDDGNKESNLEKKENDAKIKPIHPIKETKNIKPIKPIEVKKHGK